MIRTIFYDLSEMNPLSQLVTDWTNRLDSHPGSFLFLLNPASLHIFPDIDVSSSFSNIAKLCVTQKQKKMIMLIHNKYIHWLRRKILKN